MAPSDHIDVYNIRAVELAKLCIRRHRSTNFQLEIAFYTTCDGLSQPRFKIGNLKEDSSITAWISLCNGKSHEAKVLGHLDFEVWQRAPNSGCDAREGREQCDWRRCKFFEVDVNLAGLDLNWNPKAWNEATQSTRPIAVPFRLYCDYLVHLCKFSMNKDLRTDILTALECRRSGFPRSSAVHQAWCTAWPDLTSDADIWDAYNQDTHPFNLDTLWTSCRIKKAFEKIYTGCAPSTVLLQEMTAEKRSGFFPTCMSTWTFKKWERRERRRLAEGQHAYLRICF